MESCGMSCIKFLLIIFNGLFLIFGIIIIAAACVDLGMLKDYAGEYSEVACTDTDIVLIVVGVLIIVIAAFGCFGAWRESPKLLYIFAGCLVLIILLELSVAIAAAALRPQMEEGMKTHLRSSFIKNKSANDDDIVHRKFWDNVQSNLECCGVIGPSDYSNDPKLLNNPTASCCPGTANVQDEAERNRLRSDCLSSTKYYQDGCEDKILTAIHGAGITVIVTGILFCFLEIAGIVLALWLAHAIKTEGKSEETA